MWSTLATFAFLALLATTTTGCPGLFDLIKSSTSGALDNNEFEANKDPTRKLIYAHVLYRHGDRAPRRTYPTSPYGMDIWPEGSTELTHKGMVEQYLLGKYLRKRYRQLLSDRFSLTDIYVRSSDENRALQSASANLAGLYPPVKEQMLTPSLKWQPIPIHTVPLAEDFVTSILDGRCPTYDALLKRERQPIIDKYNQHYKDFFEKVRKHTGLPKLDFASIGGLYGTLTSEDAHGKKLPDWTQEVVEGDGRTAYQLIIDLFTILRNQGYNTPEKAKLTAGHLLGEILNRLKKVSKGERAIKEIQATKFVMYSSHDANVLALLYIMDLVNEPIMAPYSSAIMIDLYETEGGQHHVEVNYKGNTPVAHDCTGKKFYHFCKGADNLNPTELTTYTIPGCPSPRCPLDTFIRVLESKTSYPENKQKADCGLAETPAPGPTGDNAFRALSKDAGEDKAE